jgi:26S proteasome regulatory subunit T1
MLSRPPPRSSRPLRQQFAKRTYAFITRRTPEPASPELSELLLNYAHRPPKPLKLSHLLAYPTRQANADLVLESVAHVQSELPRRLASRVNAIQTLPYIVGTNPYIARTLDAYRKSFLWLVAQKKVQTLEENAKFTEHLATLVESHANDIPTMARGCVLRYRKTDCAVTDETLFL